MLYRYCLIAIACIAVLIGIQIPNFVDQYEQRLDAHLIEVTTNLRGFQEIANRYHGGSFDALIREHETSPSATFQGEAKPLREMYTRRQTFLREQQLLNTHLAGQAMHIFFNGHPELVRETQAKYSYNIPLTENAVIAGLVFAASVLFLTESLVALFGWLMRARRRRRTGNF